jgi:hypothetical protein
MDTKLNLMNCNANIQFNRTGLELNLTPKYTHNNVMTKCLEAKIYKLNIKNEIKMRYVKKQNLNKYPYYLHIQN